MVFFILMAPIIFCIVNFGWLLLAFIDYRLLKKKTWGSTIAIAFTVFIIVSLIQTHFSTTIAVNRLSDENMQTFVIVAFCLIAYVAPYIFCLERYRMYLKARQEKRRSITVWAPE